MALITNKAPLKLSYLFNGYNNPLSFFNALPQSGTPSNTQNMTPFTPATRTLPVTGQTYQSPVTAQPQAPVIQKPVPPTSQSSTPSALDYSKYTDPATGQIMNPQQYADFMAKRVTGGSIPNYAGNALTQGPQTTPQLQSTAMDLNNQRNDIATGTTDPYGAASKSGIAYSPTEMQAIEKAYAGIYDPALKDVFSKLDVKQKQDAAALDLKNQLALETQKHLNDIELKKTPTATESLFMGAGGTGGAGPYVPGQNPIVDSWTQRIYQGDAKITDIPSSEPGLQNAVTTALQTYGNQANGKPTTSPLGIQALSSAKALLDKVNSGNGTSAIGGGRIFEGGAGTSLIPGTSTGNFTVDFNNLKSQLSLDGSRYLRGQGSISDGERALLASAVTKLSLSQSQDEFKSTLQGIIKTLQGGGITVTDPDGGVHTFPDQTSADAFKKAIGQ